MTTTCRAQRTSANGDTKDDNYNCRSCGSEWLIWSDIVGFEIRDCLSAGPEPKTKEPHQNGSITCHRVASSCWSAPKYLTLHTWHIFRSGVREEMEIEFVFEIQVHFQPEGKQNDIALWLYRKRKCFTAVFFRTKAWIMWASSATQSASDI